MWSIALIGLVALAAAEEPAVTDPAAAVPRAAPTPAYPYPAALSPTPGSLWNESQARMMVGLDGSARSIGDLVTVRINEAASSQITVGTTSSSGTSNSASLDMLFGIEKGIQSSNDNLKDGIGMGTSSDFAFNGTGDTKRAGSVEGILTCRVIQVLPNGNLIIQGRKVVRSNAEDQFLVVQGTIRPQDIMADNSIDQR